MKKNIFYYAVVTVFCISFLGILAVIVYRFFPLVFKGDTLITGINQAISWLVVLHKGWFFLIAGIIICYVLLYVYDTKQERREKRLAEKILNDRGIKA